MLQDGFSGPYYFFFLEIMLQHQQLHLVCVYQDYVYVKLVIRDFASLKENCFLKLPSNNGFIWIVPTFSSSR